VILSVITPGWRSVSGHVLWNKVILIAWHAVVVCPAMALWQIVTPVTVLRRSVRCLPFKRRRVPGVGVGLWPFSHGPDYVGKEQDLRGRHKQRRYRNRSVKVLCGCGQEVGIAHREVASRHTLKTQVVHGQVFGHQ